MDDGKAFLDKDEILANMYTLRAGLSVIAVNSDKVDRAIKNAKTKAANDEKAAREQLAKAHKEIDSHRKKIANAQEGIKNRKAAEKAATKENVQNAGRTGINIVKNIFVITFSVAAILFCVYAILFWIMSFGAFGDPPENSFILTLYSWTFPYIIAGAEGTTWSGEPNGVFMWSAIAATVASVPLAGYGLSRLISGRAFSGMRFKSSEKKKGTKTVKEYEQDIARHEGQIATIEELLPGYKQGITTAQQKGKELIANTCMQVAPTCAAVSALHDFLKNIFLSFLDERDWNNLDLLTYYIETGRADTVKESLQLLDRQKQTDQIVSTINEAAGAVCRAVKTGLTALQDDMHRCFGILSDQITTVGYMVDSVAGG